MNYDRIRSIRKQNGMTQEELAKRIGVKRAVISKYETGAIEPSISQLEEIANALDVSLLEFMDSEKMFAAFKKGASEPIDLQNPDIQKALRRYIKDGKLEFPGLVDGAVLDAENRENELLYHFRNLNERGQQVAVERVEELTKIPENQKDKNV